MEALRVSLYLLCRSYVPASGALNIVQTPIVIALETILVATVEQDARNEVMDLESGKPHLKVHKISYYDILFEYVRPCNEMTE